VLVLGELLCDLFPKRAGVSFLHAADLVPKLGGAPANVAVQLARLGVTTALVSAVGDDPLGARLVLELAVEGVDATRIAVRKGWRTGVTLVEVDADGERRFYSLTDRRADLSLAIRDIDAAFVRGFAAVHTGTVGLRNRAPRAATNKLVDVASAAGMLVSLDVNLRFGMYRSRADLLRRARAAVKRAHVVKATAEELRVLLNARRRTAPTALACTFFRKLAGPETQLLLLTLDADGALAGTRQRLVLVPAPAVRVIDATGAGDAFVGAALARLVEHGAGKLASLNDAALEDVLVGACAAGSAACTALGATTAMVRTHTGPTASHW
jgi:fructokinase